MPFIIPSVTKLKQPLLFFFPLSVLSLLVIGATAVMAFPDNPQIYDNLIRENLTVAKLKEGYVWYSGDGSALYFLPLVGVRFSNSGFLPFEIRLENDPLLFCRRLAHDNVSFVLVYRESPEENYILRLGFPLFYSQENLRIYKVPESVKTT
jgi:hypothetical protein